jgi:hypothetical protein
LKDRAWKNREERENISNVHEQRVTLGFCRWRKENLVFLVEFIAWCPPFQLKTHFLFIVPRSVIHFRQTKFLFPFLLSSGDCKICVIPLQLHLNDRPPVVVGFLDSRGHDRCAGGGIVGSSVQSSISENTLLRCRDVFMASKKLVSVENIISRFYT